MVKIIGRKIESRPDEVTIERPDGSYAFSKKIFSLRTRTSIKPEEYALVQKGDEANSAISMVQRFNGKDYLDTNVEVLNLGLIVPRTSKLITQIINVNQALTGKGVLYDPSGKLIEGKKLEIYANTLNHNCWVWLNDSFEKNKQKKGFLDLDVVYITGLEDGKPIFKREPLQKCLDKDCYADLESVNNQGFPTKKSPVKKYEAGKSIYFWYPRANRAVGFYANPGNAGLYCYGDPQDADARLGVFDCAEGASAKN